MPFEREAQRIALSEGQSLQILPEIAIPEEFAQGGRWHSLINTSLDKNTIIIKRWGIYDEKTASDNFISFDLLAHINKYITQDKSAKITQVNINPTYSELKGGIV